MKKTKGDILQEQLAHENLAAYGPMSRQVLSNLGNLNDQGQSHSEFPTSIHRNGNSQQQSPQKGYPLDPYDTVTQEPSIAKRDFNFIGNREKKEYVQGGIAIYEQARQLSPVGRDKTLIGQQTLKEVQHKLNMMKKNKE